MARNGPLMHKVHPLFDFDMNIDLPTCMYKMSNLLGGNSETSVVETVSATRRYEQEDRVKEKQYLLQVEKRQLELLELLEETRLKVMNMKRELGCFQKSQDIVIKANPHHPPLSLWIYYHIISKTVPTQLVTYVHSSLKVIPPRLQWLKKLTNCPQQPTISLSVVWREGELDHEMMVNPVQQGAIEGEVNIARYLSRLTDSNYEKDPLHSSLIDYWLEVGHSSLLHGNGKERQAALKAMNSHLGKSSYANDDLDMEVPFLVNNTLSVADIVLWSILVQTGLYENLPVNVTNWYLKLAVLDMFKSMKPLC